MSPGIFIKKILSFMAVGPFSRRIEQDGGGQCLILTYHRILSQDDIGPWVEPGMYVTPDVLRLHIRFLKRFFNIIAVDRLNEMLTDTTVGKKPLCVLSFDDGWLDFYQNAWPVLREENVPAVVYLPTALIGSKEVFWTDRLGRLLGNDHGRAALAAQLAKTGAKVKALHSFDRAIALLKQYPYQEVDQYLASCEAELGISCEVDDRSFMNWDEVRELYDTGLISFGSHTVNHAILTTLPAIEISAELQNSMEKLRSKQVVHDAGISFCYPNGNYTDEIAMMVRECGYATAMTCSCGWNRTGADLFALKRIGMHQDISFTESLFAYRLNRFY